MVKSNYSTISKIFGYLLFCVVLYVFTIGWAMGNFMNTKQNKNMTKFGSIFIFSIFIYISYLFWGKNFLIIPVLLVLYLIYKHFMNTKQEARYIY
jgi:asparagine N-glycosylation enzyme membrane subunit Stt3